MANLNFDVLSIIFQHLNSTDLYNASAVCRLWYTCAKYERSRRGPVMFAEEGEERINIEAWERKMINKLRLLPIMPSLQIQFYQKDIPFTRNENRNCLCQYFPRNYYNISIGSIYLERNDNIRNTIFVPNSSIQVITRTFFMRYNARYLFCPEQKDYKIINFECSYILRPSFDQIFYMLTKSCMILLMDHKSIKNVTQFLEIFLKWYPKFSIPVWGGIGDSLKICSTIPNSNFCYIGMGWSFIFVSSSTLKTWILTLGRECRSIEDMETKFADFKKKIQLRRHAIAFIYIPRYRFLAYGNLEADIYKRTFPEIPLFYAGGTSGLGGSLQEFLRVLQLLTRKRSKMISLRLHTTIMILTY